MGGVRPTLVACGPTLVEFADTLGVEATIRLDEGSKRVGLGAAVDSMVMRIHDMSVVPGGPPAVVAGARDAGLTPLVPALTIAASALDVDLVLDGPVCPVALEGAQAANRLMSQRLGMPRVTINAATTRPSELRGGRSPNRGLLFSRGLDSMAVLVAMEAAGTPPTHLVGMDWVDPPYAGSDQQAIWRSTALAAAERGLPLVRVTTNARSLLDSIVSWQDAHVAVLVGPALALGGVLGALGVSSTFPAGHTYPYASSEDIDPLWSSSAVSVEHRLDVPGGRVDKAAATLTDPWAIRWLKVCWERAGDGNCGRCRKCLMTMSALWLAGAGSELATCFDGPLSPDAIVAVVGRSPVQAPWNFREVADELRNVATGRPTGPSVVVDAGHVERAFAHRLADAWDRFLIAGRGQERRGSPTSDEERESRVR